MSNKKKCFPSSLFKLAPTNIWIFHFSQADEASAQDSILDKAAATATVITTNNKQGEDIMSVLLAHEKKGGTNSNALNSLPQESSDSSDNEELVEMLPVHNGKIIELFE